MEVLQRRVLSTLYSDSTTGIPNHVLSSRGYFFDNPRRYDSDDDLAWSIPPQNGSASLSSDCYDWGSRHSSFTVHTNSNEQKRVQQYAVDVTLDPDTANPALILSDDGKQVNCGNVWKNLTDNPKRFSPSPCVFGKQSLSSGRFYFEVQVKEKTDWVLGVARESINRKGKITLSPQNGFWTIWLRNGNEYEALDDPPVDLSLKSRPQKVGVFVDYEEGLVSFYDVDAAALIYSFTGCSFTEKLYPNFCPFMNHGGRNSAPLIICPVN
ncbi:E3 ubiquitin-protein ligase TRIM21-like [Scomber japonicus]|uniref:E3 ubiquitin-protein ligase TRIM21-like n=1 Tax=Scomber japonicus TaxID=13676 RepID=UPI00230657D6|nr:E3 ubiquitin-protein ligase TRIM21-like [Scomber japonicus]